ncbi:MAG: SpoIID/LytB domain-containing protein [Blautia sp.]|jgi:stage II sporulation protein D
MYKEKDWIITFFLLFLLLPWLLTIFLSGREKCPISRRISLEEYVPAVTASQISWDSPKEAIKAQSIIARTNLYIRQREGKETEVLETAADNIKSMKMDGQELERFLIFQEAADQTGGLVLKLNDQLKEIPYHSLSQGKTRDGAEVLGESYGYIPSVDTPEDIDSPLYVEGCYFSVQELENRLKEKYPGFVFGENGTVEIKNTDGTGYVTEMQIGTQVFPGEEVKEALGLPSSCFTIQQLEGEIRFLCKGIGHGMGMSQYTARKMAEQGKDYQEILSYFFPELQISEEKQRE